MFMNSIRAAAVAALFTLPLAVPAAAESIPKIDFASMPVGTIFVYEEKDGDVTATKFLGLVDGVYVTEYRAGSDAGGSLLSRSSYDTDGNLVLWEGDSGDWAFSYEAGDDDDELVVGFEHHDLSVGNYLTVVQGGREDHVYRVASVEERLV